MKYSDKPRHYAPKKTNRALTNSNAPGGRYRPGCHTNRTLGGIGDLGFMGSVLGLLRLGIGRRAPQLKQKVMVVG